MITKRVRCQNCNFEQFVQEDVKECFCGKCGSRIQISDINSCIIEKQTIGDLSSKNKKVRKKYRNRFIVCLFIQIVLLVVSFRIANKYRYDLSMQNTVNIVFTISGITILILAFVVLFAFLRSLPNAQDRLIDDAAKNSPNMSENSFYYEYSDELNEIKRKNEEARIRHQEEMEYQNKVSKLEKEYHHYRSMSRTFDKDTSKADWDNEQADIALAKIASLRKK